MCVCIHRGGYTRVWERIPRAVDVANANVSAWVLVVAERDGIIVFMYVCMCVYSNAEGLR